MYLSCPIFSREIFRTSNVVVRFSNKYGTCPTLFFLQKSPHHFGCQIQVKAYLHTAELKLWFQFSDITTFFTSLTFGEINFVTKKDSFRGEIWPFLPKSDNYGTCPRIGQLRHIYCKCRHFGSSWFFKRSRFSKKKFSLDVDQNLCETSFWSGDGLRMTRSVTCQSG